MTTVAFGVAFGAFEGVFESAGPAAVWLIVMAFVFIECALIVGMFLPGDSMLLGAGVVLGQQTGAAHAWALSAVATVLAVTGNHVGYLIGRRTGTRVWARQGGRVLNRRHLERAHRFFERWGFWAVVVARWMPWVRTLAPVVAGAARMDRRVFLAASVTGAVAWVPGLILLGYYGADLIEQLPWLAPVLTVLVAACFAITVAVGLWRYRQDMSKPVDDSADLPRGELDQPVRGVSLAD
ncbi:MAG: DedA family protein [Pseudonocardiaceae bacterium]